MDPVFQNNVILSQTERLTMNSRPANPKYARNKNTLVVGGSGSGKTRFFIKPNLLQMHSSYVLTDPKGTVLPEVGNALLKNGYRIKIFNTINFKKSMHYNPFAYVHDEKDILKLVTLITNTMNITMAVFDVAQHVVTQAGGIIAGSTAIDDSTLATVQSTLEAMEIGPLLSIFLQTIIVRFLIYILSALIFVIVYARMIEIYLMVSLAPIPFSTFGNREQSMIGQNYLRSLFALGFQGFLIMVCVGIYAVLIQSVAFSTDIIGSLWGVLGYTILLAFTLFKTGAVAKSILHAH